MTTFEIKAIEKLIADKSKNLRPIENGHDTINVNDYKTCQYGYKNKNSYVGYKPSYLAYIPATNSKLLFSDEFSGCALVKFHIDTKKYVAHISMESGSEWDCNKWNQFVNDARISNYKLFYPYKGNVKEIMEGLIEFGTYGVYNELSCVGIIDEQDICYSGIYDVKRKKIIYLQYWKDIFNNQYECTQINGGIIIKFNTSLISFQSVENKIVR